MTIQELKDEAKRGAKERLVKAVAKEIAKRNAREREVQDAARRDATFSEHLRKIGIKTEMTTEK